MANPANDDQGLDNQLYYNEIIRYLQDPTQVSSADWVKTQAANYFVSWYFSPLISSHDDVYT